jgi:hypothetical protein
MLVDDRLKGYHLVLYSLEEPDRKSNGACLAAVQAVSKALWRSNASLRP